MLYEISTITDGTETLLAATSSKARAKEIYRGTYCSRVRIDGRTLLIHEADKRMGGPCMFRPRSKEDERMLGCDQCEPPAMIKQGGQYGKD